MGAEKIEDTISRLESQMYGHNYQVTFGLHIFENCYNLDDFKREVKQNYKDSRPEEVQPIPLTEADLWEDINFALNYRGDSGAGLSLSGGKEKMLKVEQDKYKTFIKQFINKEIGIYSYPDEEGIPAYSVFWDFRFIVFTNDNKCLFIFGAASD
jgi:hypothetical protein